MVEIIIDIDEHGNATIEGKGFVGEDCVKLTKELEEALGVVENRRFKPEYRLKAGIKRPAGR